MFNELVQNNNSTQNIAIDNILFKRWIDYVDVKPESIKTYTKAVKLFIEWLQDNKISYPTREDIIIYRKKLEGSKNPRTNNLLKPTTIQTYIISIRQFFKWLEQEGLYRNVADNVKGAKLDNEFKKDYLTPEQVKLVLSGIDQNTQKGLRDYAIVALMVTGGLRTVEVSSADIGDIRVSGGSVVLYIKGKGRDEKAEYVKIAQPAYAAIKRYLGTRCGNEKYQSSDPLFSATSNNNKGGRMTTKSISEIVKKCFERAGINSDRLTAHSLRHTFATLNLKEGKEAGVVDILEQTRQAARHKKIETTLIYAHHINREENKSEERVAGVIFQ